MVTLELQSQSTPTKIVSFSFEELGSSFSIIIC